MKGFYSPIDRLMEQSTRPRGTGAEYMAELSKRPGYKPQEAEDRNLQTLMALPKMERAAFMAELKAKPAVMPEESTFAESILKNRGLNVVPDVEPHHEDYVLPGGTNYREILLQHPNGTFPGVPEHFGGAPNVLASIRAKDRVGPNGEKILHLEEIQSDWHQQGREKGYKPNAVELNKMLDTAKKKNGLLYRQLYDAKVNIREAEERKANAANPEEQALHNRMLQEHQRSLMDLMPQVMRADDELHKAQQLAARGVPDAPFKKDWHELALKKMIHHAATNGYDQIAITPGAEQADRYGLSKHVSRITHMTHLDDPDSGILFAFDPTGRQIVEKRNIPHAELPEYIGKEGAQKLLAQKPDETGYRELSGQNLEVGGEGMKGFYDKMVPTFLNKFGKKYGSQVQPGTIETRQYTPNDRSLRQLAGYSTPVAETAPVHMFNITPQMREDVVKNGIPLYAEGGGVHMAGGGDPKDKSFGERLFKKFEHLPKVGPPSPFSPLDVAYELYKYKTGTFPIENWYSDLEFRTRPRPMDTGSVPVGTQFNPSDFDSSELNKNLEPVQRRAKGGKVEEDVPRETTKAYKLFRVHPKHPGKLFPLFVDANTPVEMGKWINAKEGEMAQGKVKSKIGPLAYRPGWHAGDLPIATHIGEKSDPTLTAPDLRPENHAWAEVEMPNDVDWQTEATKRGTNAQGKLVPVKAHITDQIPVGGHYRYKTNPNMTGNWLIGGSMKVNRVLNDKEVSKINKAAGLADLPRAQPFNKKVFGFAKGGAVGPEEWMSEEHVNHKAKGGSVMGINVASDRKSDRKYADMIVDGHKTFESRNSDTLRPYVGKRVAIVRTGEGKAKAIGEVTIGEPTVVNKQKFRALEDKHHVPEGSAFDIGNNTKHLYPLSDPVRYEQERDVGHGIVARKVLAHGGAVKPTVRKTIKGKVTISPNMDVMQYELLNRKAK